MLMCWDTEAEKRPTFKNLVTFFVELLKVKFFFFLIKIIILLFF